MKIRITRTPKSQAREIDINPQDNNDNTENTLAKQ